MLKKLVHITFIFLLANIMLAEVCTVYSWINKTSQQVLIEEEDHKDNHDHAKKLKKKSFDDYFNKNAVLLQSIDAFLRSRNHGFELILHKDPHIEILCPPPNFS
ncbi:hypothetical protein NF867_16170 [Solitalea sp. MAHUQ-68]|uniref:Uncharacterized protein n=1 Tax=Solitalea agri TaxID=2953739 RepID=A0A9X2JDQ6_9SPHI|nr:hypothetical protein [Solitalea agri]MCO4294398.1 hypothetical protein [Solitalea agri]